MRRAIASRKAEFRAALNTRIMDLTSHEKSVRDAASGFLGNLSPAAISLALPRVIDLLNHKDPEIRIAAASSLSGMGLQAKAALPALYASLTHHVRQVRLQALRAIVSIGSQPDDVFPAVRKLLNDRFAETRRSVVSVLYAVRLGAPQVEALLNQALKDPAKTVRDAAEKVLKLRAARRGC